MKSCLNCADRSTPEDVCLDLTDGANGPNGIGDVLMGATLAAGWVRDNPGRRLTLAVKEGAFGWLSLFGGIGRLTTEAPASMARIHDASRRGGQHYVEFVASQPGASRALPDILPSDPEAAAWAEEWKGRVVLAPLSLGVCCRHWHLSHWLRLESMLARRGTPCVVVAAGDERGQLHEFRSPLLCGERPARLAALMRASVCVVGNESGPAHLAGALQVPCVVMGAYLSVNTLHGFWPRTVTIEGHPLGDASLRRLAHFKLPCKKLCPSIQSIEPAQVLDLIDRATVLRPVGVS